MAQGIRKLIDKWDLDRLERDKLPVYVQDLTELNETSFEPRKSGFILDTSASSCSLHYARDLHSKPAECPSITIMRS
jgi:hypothetical protein